jgi:hypothetical protein
VEKEQALSIIKTMDEWMDASDFDIQKLTLTENQLPGFHQWTNKKTVLAAYNILKPEETGYYFLFIDWHRNDNYYLVIYMQNKSTTVAEIQRTSLVEDVPHITWTYNPLKRDGMNDVRKSYFKQTFGSLAVHIPLPAMPKDVEQFCENLFKLCHNRIRADRASELFNL